MCAFSDYLRHTFMATKIAFRHVLSLCAIASLIACSALRSAASRDAEQATVEVIVSRYEARLRFPRDTTTSWGWPTGQSPTDPQANYFWSVGFPRSVGHKFILARHYQGYDTIGARFSSLAALLRSSRTIIGVCSSGMIAQCDQSHTRVNVNNGRVTISLRDSAKVAELFGMLPDSVTVQTHFTPAGRSAPVRYIEPRIQAPDSAARASHSRALRDYEYSIRRLSRTISPSKSVYNVGDSLFFHLDEHRCKHDVCWSNVIEADWSVSDSTVLHISSGPLFDVVRQRRRPSAPWRVFVRAIKPGTAILRARWDTITVDSVARAIPNPVELEIRVIAGSPGFR
jgi:hypothetical protein